MQQSAKCIINTLVASTDRAAHFIFAVHPSVFSNNCLDIIIRTHYSILAKPTTYLRVKDGHRAGASSPRQNFEVVKQIIMCLLVAWILRSLFHSFPWLFFPEK